jgi:hypothetical protein
MMDCRIVLLADVTVMVLGRAGVFRCGLIFFGWREEVGRREDGLAPQSADAGFL